MANQEPSSTKAQEKAEDEIEELQLSLPTEQWFIYPMYHYKGSWYLNYIFEGAIAVQTNFQANDTDIILASLPKTGTTWLKSLIYAIVNREKFSHNLSQHPFHTKNPHELVFNLEIDVYNKVVGKPLDLDAIPSPRLLATHLSYLSLPDSIKSSKCHIVYVCRNPLDTFVSIWQFFLQFEPVKDINPNMEMMEKYVDKYCTGVSPWGPYEDHVLGYWKEGMLNPQKVLFLEYEGLKVDPKAHVTKLAEFVGCPFSEEEDKRNVTDEIIKLCSLDSLKEMEVNKSGRVVPAFENKAFFRKGEVGDWTNYLTPSMVKQFQKIQEKLMKAGFSFAYYQMNL